jgi:hypothetical protein
MLDRLAFELPDAGGRFGLEGGAFINDSVEGFCR